MLKPSEGENGQIRKQIQLSDILSLFNPRLTTQFLKNTFYTLGLKQRNKFFAKSMPKFGT